MKLNLCSCLTRLCPTRWAEGPYSPHLRVLLVTTVLFFILKTLGYFSGLDPAGQLPLLLALAWLARDLKLEDASLPFAILHRTIIGFFTLYLVFTYPAMEGEALVPWSYEWFVLHWGRALAIVGGLLAWFRPGLGLVLLPLVAWYKHNLQEVFGLPITKTDYYSVLEFGVFLILGLLVAVKLPRICSWMKAEAPATVADSSSRTHWRYADVIVLGAIAVHFANYFYSAVEKLKLGGGPLSWLLENNTHNIMMAAELQGLLPLLVNDTLLRWSHLIVSELVLPINVLTLFGQLFALIVLRRIWWAIGITAFFDFTHVVIYLVSGIFFWKWIILNLAIVAALSCIRHKIVPRPVFVSLMGMTLIAPFVFFVAYLGWYDTASFNRISVTVVMEDGRELEVPSNYFLTNSVVFGQQRLGYPYEGHFPVGSFGSTSDAEVWRKGDACELEVDASQYFLKNQENAEKVARAILTPHRYILPRTTANGRYLYDAYPHHIWSNPLHYWEFLWADKRAITSFIFGVDSLCMKLDDEGRVQADVKHRSRFEIPVTD